MKMKVIFNSCLRISTDSFPYMSLIPVISLIGVERWFICYFYMLTGMFENDCVYLANSNEKKRPSTESNLIGSSAIHNRAREDSHDKRLHALNLVLVIDCQLIVLQNRTEQ